MLQSGDEVGVHILDLFAHLLEEHLLLDDRIVLLGVCWCDFLTIDAEFEDIDGGFIILSDLGQRAKFLRNVSDESRLDQCRLDDLLEDIVSDLKVFALAIHFNFKRTCLLQLLFTRVVEPVRITCGLNDEVLILRFAPFTIEVNDCAVRALDLERTDHALGDVLDQALRQLHHATEVRVGLIEFEHGKFGIMTTGQAFVTKYTTDFKDPVFAAYKHTLEIELQCDAHVETAIQRVEMRHERTRCRATGHTLQHRGFDFLEIALPEILAHLLDN